jgi:hypothetical protein
VRDAVRTLDALAMALSMALADLEQIKLGIEEVRGGLDGAAGAPER